MSDQNLLKIEEVNNWIDGCGQFLQGLQNYTNEYVDPRRFKGADLSKAVGVANLATIHMAERDGRLPPPDLDDNKRRIGATLAQVLLMQDCFSTSPCRELREEPQTLSFINFKGGCYKSTTALYAGSYYATLGYRILLVDLDPQASLTLNCGLFPDIESSYEKSLAPYIIDDESTSDINVKSVVRNTYLPNMHIIPACLDLAGVEFELSNEVIESRLAQDIDMMAGVFFRVKEALSEIKYDYDIIILDGTPSLGLLPLNIILASDTTIVPVPTETTDFASTRSFCKLYKQQAEILNRSFGNNIPLPGMFILPTRYSPSKFNATISSREILNAVRDIFGVKCLDTVIMKHESVVSNLSFFRRTVFDVNAGDCNVPRDARKKAIANFSTAFDEILEKAVFPNWASKRSHLEDKGII